MVAAPPAASLANRSSACSRLSGLIDTEKLLPLVTSGPKPELSLPISTPDPIGSDTCMIRSPLSAGTPMSCGASAKVWMKLNSPPNTER